MTRCTMFGGRATCSSLVKKTGCATRALLWKVTMPPNDQDLLADLNADDGTNPRPVANRIRTVSQLSAKIDNRLSKIDQVLQLGPPIEPQTMTDLQSLQTSASHILALTNSILARYAQ